MVDIESDGPIPGDYSMICFGAVVVEPTLSKTFYGELRPISERWIPDALAVSGFTREQALAFPDAESVMRQFQAWLSEHSGGRPMFISDNNGFDWQFINWYFHHFTGSNPFGFFVHQPRLALQGHCSRHDPELQAPPQDAPYSQPC